MSHTAIPLFNYKLYGKIIFYLIIIISVLIGSGGNNHALDYYDETKYPLAVKLGTITPGGADVYSYEEDSMVMDPKLSEHLSHFGINMMIMSKVSSVHNRLIVNVVCTFPYAYYSTAGAHDGKKGVLPSYHHALLSIATCNTHS